MAPHDPVQTARNKIIEKMKDDLRAMLPKVLDETDFESEASLNATIGGKAQAFIDLHHEVILSPDQYATCYMKGFKAAMSHKNARFPNAQGPRAGPIADPGVSLRRQGTKTQVSSGFLYN